MNTWQEQRPIDFEERKSRGAFFTPPAVAEFIAEWALRSPDDRMFEPSCGEAVFILAAIDRLRQLGGTPSADSLAGIDLHQESVAIAEELVAAVGASAALQVGDFFSVPAHGIYDAVIGNPPYIRYQSFTGEARARGRAAALAQGVRIDGLSSSWAPFTVHASAFLRPEGRLGLVLPGELLTVNYTAPVRRFLLERFARVRLVLFEKRIFPGVLEEVVLLLAEGQGPTDHFEVIQAKDASALHQLQPTAWYPDRPDRKWTAALLDAPTARTYEGLIRNGAFCDLEVWGRTDLGMVTGNNKYFTLSAQHARELNIPKQDLVPISPPGSRHLRGLAFGQQAWNELADEGRAVYLFSPKLPLSAGADNYIQIGEARGVHRAYKCRVRHPWWTVPKIAVPDLFLTYMNHDTPRLVANKARVSYLNSIHGVFLQPGYRDIGQDLLPIAALNSVTLLGAELVGRSYGGGMLKVEPKEADRLPVPSPETVKSCEKDLRSLRPQLTRHLRNNQLLEAVRMVDRVLLLRSLKVSSADIELLRVGRAHLFDRRATRNKDSK